MSDDPMEAIARFGKYKGATWQQIAERDPSYAEWAMTADLTPERVREALSEWLIENNPDQHANDDGTGWRWDHD